MREEKYARNASFRLAVMGGAYGNVPALEACVRDAQSRSCHQLAFLGDAIGFCGHSDETLTLIREHFSVRVAGNHEQQAAAGADDCGCNYLSAEDERLGCLAFRYACQSLSAENRRWLATWPQNAVVPIACGNVLLCHGSPSLTNEFLYQSQLDDDRLRHWLDEFRAVGFVCTHSGLPWVWRLSDGRFAANCGVVGKPDHDGDPAVHYATIELDCDEEKAPGVSIERVEYDHEAWSRQLQEEGVDEIFLEPLRTGIWTCGVASLPLAEQPVPAGAARA